MRRYGKEWTDAAMLDVLDRVERRGESMEVAGAAHGFSRSAVAGMLKRVRDDLARSEAAPLPRGAHPVNRPENMPGAMGARWWARGLARRGRVAA